MIPGETFFGAQIFAGLKKKEDKIERLQREPTAVINQLEFHQRDQVRMKHRLIAATNFTNFPKFPHFPKAKLNFKL